MAYAENGYVYAPITTSEGVYIYRVDIASGTAVRGAHISATFVGGLFRLD